MKNEIFNGIGVEDECRFFGTKVQVGSQLGGDYNATISRILNAGNLIEVKPDGFDSVFRVNNESITILELVDHGSKKTPEAKPEAKPAPKIIDPIENPRRFASYLKHIGVKRDWAWSRYVQAWGLRAGTSLNMDARDFLAIYDAASASDYYGA